jgi:hypothetical protein
MTWDVALSIASASATKASRSSGAGSTVRTACFGMRGVILAAATASSLRRPWSACHRPTPPHPFGSYTTYHFLAGFSVSQVPLNPAGTTNPSPIP